MNLVELALHLRPIIEKAMQSLDIEDALQAATLYPKWESGVQYQVGYRVRHNDVLYSVLTEHTSQEAWTPDVVPSLFAQVLIPDENVIPEWIQPNSTNPYALGDKVSHNGKIWISDYDNNVWEPGVFGWSEVVK